MKIKANLQKVIITTETEVIKEHLVEYLHELENALNRGYGKVISVVHEDYIILETEKRSRKKRNRFSS
jgi:ABC-type uncharacterized transport system ATPase component